jgi:WD40 repeat protein/tRNA A-37 threonylcarbamoyl transferase component Bud32
MTASWPPDPVREGQLEEVLGDYMQRLDRGETVDREQILARHPELADQLRSYFAGSDELEQLRQQARAGPQAECRSRDASQSSQPHPPPGGGGGPGGGPRRVGDYELLEQIGQGGMGVVYKARQLSLARLVAVKMIRTDRLATPADVPRFRTEAEAVASLDHPNIVSIYEVGEHDGQPFFSMKLIEGGSLTQHLPRLAPDPSGGVSLLAAVARAVHYAHQRGLLHRDLKPANILLDAQGRPHVTDFGLAKRLGAGPGEASLTQEGVIVGTPDYMAPEQAAPRGGVSTATDVHSLGAILYELLTGRPPFRAETPLDTLFQLREREPASPRSLNRRVDRDLETICLKCLQKEPGKRYPSAEALADDLERWLRGEPVQARPVSRRERVLKWVRRRPELAALVALLVLALVAGFAGVIWQWQRAEGEYRKAADLAKSERRTAYARAIPMAYAEWRAGNAGPAEQVLEKCPAELRGWEWHYLQRLFRVRQLATLESRSPPSQPSPDAGGGQGGGVLAVAFSPDGARVASGDQGGDVRIWTLRGQKSEVRGQKSAGREERQPGGALTADARTLRGRGTRDGGSGAVTAVAFSPDSRRLASGSVDGSVCVWDAVSGEELVTWRGHAAGVTSLAFDPTGRQLASTGKGEPPAGELKLWNPAKGEALVCTTYRTLLMGVAFRPDGKSLVTAGHDWKVIAWSAATLERVLTFKAQTEWGVPWTSVACSADGRWVAAGSPEGLVRVWDAASGQELFSVPTPARAGVSGVAFAGPDDRFVTAATVDNMVQVWFTRSAKPAFTLRGHRRPVAAVACSPNGRCLASGSLDRTVKLWDIDRLDDDLTLGPATEGVTAIAFSPTDGPPNGRPPAKRGVLAAATRDKAVAVWDRDGNTTLTVHSLPSPINGLAFSPGGGQLAFAGEDGAIRLRDAVSGREMAVLLGHAGRVAAVAFHPDGAALASAGADGTVRLWDVPTGRQRICLRGGGAVHAVAFSPDGRRLAGAGEDGGVWVWDAVSGEQQLDLVGHCTAVHAVAFSPDGQHLATAGRDEAIRVWDAADGELVRVLRGHAGMVRGLAYGPGGRLASVGDDTAVRLWDEAGQEVLALRGHREALRAVAFSGDGHRLASAGDEGTIKVWDGSPLE